MTVLELIGWPKLLQKPKYINLTEYKSFVNIYWVQLPPHKIPDTHIKADPIVHGFRYSRWEPPIESVALTQTTVKSYQNTNYSAVLH